jgi:hypothetical protein
LLAVAGCCWLLLAVAGCYCAGQFVRDQDWNVFQIKAAGCDDGVLSDADGGVEITMARSMGKANSSVGVLYCASVVASVRLPITEARGY